MCLDGVWTKVSNIDEVQTERWIMHYGSPNTGMLKAYARKKTVEARSLPGVIARDRQADRQADRQSVVYVRTPKFALGEIVYALINGELVRTTVLAQRGLNFPLDFSIGYTLVGISQTVSEDHVGRSAKGLYDALKGYTLH